MPRERINQAELEYHIQQELNLLKNKLNFWNQQLPDIFLPAYTHEQKTYSPNLTELFDKLTDEDLKNLKEKDPDTFILACIGHEFVWGQKPPKTIQDERESFIDKINKKQKEISASAEKLWAAIITVDTDMF